MKKIIVHACMMTALIIVLCYMPSADAIRTAVLVVHGPLVGPAGAPVDIPAIASGSSNALSVLSSMDFQGLYGLTNIAPNGLQFSDGSIPMTSSNSFFAGSFSNADLSVTGTVTITHNMGYLYPQVFVYNYDHEMVMPDDVVIVDSNSTMISVSSYGDIGTTSKWSAVFVVPGTRSDYP